MAHRRRHIDALRGGIVQRRVSSAVPNVDVASCCDKHLDALTAFGWNGAMEESIPCAIACAITKHGVGEHRCESVWVRAVDNSAGIVRASNRVDYGKHTTMQRTQVHRTNVPTRDAAARQTKTASREGDMLDAEHKQGVRSLF